MLTTSSPPPSLFFPRDNHLTFVIFLIQGIPSQSKTPNLLAYSRFTFETPLGGLYLGLIIGAVVLVVIIIIVVVTVVLVKRRKSNSRK